jgi:DNA-binding beta-propeller fold protein YncE
MSQGEGNMSDQATVPQEGRSTAGQALLVANTYGSDIWVFSVPDYQHLQTIEVGGHPDEIKLPASQDVLYVPRRDKDDLVAIGAESGQELWRVELAGSPHHITLTPDDRFIYVPIFNQPFVEIIDVDERRVVDQVEVGYGGHGSLVTKDGSKVYVGTMVADQLCAIDTQSHQVVERHLFHEAVRPFDLSPDEKRMYVQLSKLHGFLEVELATGVVLRQVTLPLPPSGSPVLPREFPHTVNHGLACTPDGQFLLAAASLDRFLAVYSLPDLELVATVPVADEPNWIIFDAESEVAFVSNRASDEISVIELGSWVEARRIKVGNYPQRMAIRKLSS